ncbi:50S ribosomal protein L22 [bacterium]|nr:50S ribosomal protein L22 [bacterium]
MEFIAKGRYLRVAPRKMQAVATLIRGKNINTAFNILAVTKKRSCYFIEQVLKSAVANSKDSGQHPDNKVDEDKLYVKEIYVGEGPSIKRWLPRAMGRATMVKKRMSHVTIKLEEKK